MEANFSRTYDYSPGHPWYYVHGGHVLAPKQIIASVKQRQYQGYRAEKLQAIAKKPEPHRSATFRKLRQEVLADFRNDLSRYRTLACELHRYRAQHGWCKATLFAAIFI